MKVGDIVKSLDFVYTNDCYYIGRVTRIDANSGHFEAKVIDRIWKGKHVVLWNYTTFVAPLQGQLIGDDRGIRVEVIA
jgi:hypothetical protein